MFHLTSRAFMHLASAAAVLALTVSACSAVTYDPAADFSLQGNPNGVWSYGYSTSLGGAMTLYDQNGTYSGTPEIYWMHNLWLNAPNVLLNPTGNWLTNGPGGFGQYQLIGPHQLCFHPGPNGEYSTIRFTAPASGLYQLTASFFGVDTLPTTTDVHISDNGVSLYDGNVNSVLTPIGPGTIYASLHAGDHLDFAVGYGADGDFTSDETGITAQIVPVPEPAVSALVGLGTLFGAAGFRRRRHPVTG